MVPRHPIIAQAGTALHERRDGSRVDPRRRQPAYVFMAMQRKKSMKPAPALALSMQERCIEQAREAQSASIDADLWQRNNT